MSVIILSCRGMTLFKYVNPVCVFPHFFFLSHTQQFLSATCEQKAFYNVVEKSSQNIILPEESFPKFILAYVSLHSKLLQ